MTEHVTLSQKELERLQILGRVAEKRLRQRQAGELLGITERHVRRLVRAVAAHGAAGLASRRRGRASPRQLPPQSRDRALALVREHYADFGPTLAHEKLTEQHGLALCVETLRAWMTAEGIWVPRARRARRSHPPRVRRDCFGELIQLDGCDHHWFEARGPRCTLLVYVDDATSSLMELRFADSESTFDYFAATRRYLERHGKPMALYSDKLSVFHVSRGQHAASGPGRSQFGRAMDELNIDVICANSPQAKGRVERSNLTLQDRLVKELRLRGICEPGAGQAYLEEFREDYNRRFARPPRHSYDAHRPVREDLETIFTVQEERHLSANLTLSYHRTLYVLDDSPAHRRLRRHKVVVHEDAQGTVTIRHRGRALPHRAHPKETARIAQGTIVENKHLEAAFACIAAQQRARDAQRLAHPKVPLRVKKRIRAQAGRPT